LEWKHPFYDRFENQNINSWLAQPTGLLKVGPCSPSAEKRTAKDTKFTKILVLLSELSGSKALANINLRMAWLSQEQLYFKYAFYII
jgi:hypothetical protein